MVKESRYMLIIKCCILFLVIGGIGYWLLSKEYPTTRNIDVFFAKYQTLSTKQQKVDNLKTILERLSRPRDTSDDYCLQYFMDRLREEYFIAEDDAILIALDQTDIDSGFANFVCDFYASVKNTKIFYGRYLSDPQARAKIERCIGISYTERELLDIFSDNRED